MRFRALKLSNLESFRALKASNLATGTTSIIVTFFTLLHESSATKNTSYFILWNSYSHGYKRKPKLKTLLSKIPGQMFFKENYIQKKNKSSLVYFRFFLRRLIYKYWKLSTLHPSMNSLKQFPNDPQAVF